MRRIIPVLHGNLLHPSHRRREAARLCPGLAALLANALAEASGGAGQRRQASPRSLLLRKEEVIFGEERREAVQLRGKARGNPASPDDAPRDGWLED